MPIKVTNESSDSSTAYSERQVMLYPAAMDNPIAETMEDIKISIVNDRATNQKRQQEQNTAETPCSKRFCGDFSCSTPHSKSTPSTSKSKGVNWSHVNSPSHALEQNQEWDDSLLEPSDNEDDTPLYLTVDEIDSLLEDDSPFAAEPFGLDDCSSTGIVTPESEDEKEKLCTSPYSQLDGSVTLTEETLCVEDLNNYATMAPSPSHSIIHSVEVQVPKQKSNIVGNVKSSDSVQETNGMSTSGVPILDKTEALIHELASDCSLYTVDVLVEWNDDPELSFDGDIDDLLAISPKGSTSSEEETDAEPSRPFTEQIGSAVSDSLNTFKHSNSVPVNQTAHSAVSDTADVHQQLSPSTSDALEVHCPPSTVSEPPKDSGSPSMPTVVIFETQSNTDAAEDVKPSTSTKSDAQSTAGLSDQSVNSSATQTSSSQQTVQAPVSKSAAAQERARAAVTPQPTPEVTPQPTPEVTPLPRPAHRLFLSPQLECGKNLYLDQVLMHIQASEGANTSEVPLHELAFLLNQTSTQNQNWQHPSDFSRRNHPRRGKKPSKRCTLNEWVEKSGGTVQRFMNIPSSFQRNPLPEGLPFQIP
ncbi:PREDICTED: S100P-binding protein-like [Nanorana parkeri]|uniref:S100P-binding protein-like n=1 Tax=Nanorana parkeri TaxID=125878 RepID=UPI000854114E|nr:PREDICTED: S100P-binding protein-like [Nanorana parkeri]